MSDYDVGVTILFRDEQALRDYLVHPLHQAAARETLRPLAHTVRVYDFSVSEIQLPPKTSPGR